MVEAKGDQVTSPEPKLIEDNQTIYSDNMSLNSSVSSPSRPKGGKIKHVWKKFIKSNFQRYLKKLNNSKHKHHGYTQSTIVCYGVQVTNGPGKILEANCNAMG